MYQGNEPKDQVFDKTARTELPKSSLEHKKSFRLKNDDVTVESRRSYLIKYNFKQRIDSMFDETRSAILETENIQRHTRVFRAVQSECGGKPSIGNHNRSNAFEKRAAVEFSDERKIKNTVQARIEKMFADISSSEMEDDSGTPDVLRFQVDHIGSLPLFSKITSLQGLQEPLKKLYFNYRKNKSPSSKLQALLEISSLGLKVQNFEQNRSCVKEQLNPFPSIAVWAALKFVCRPQQSANKTNCGSCGLEYAFLPIVLDQHNTERSTLFHPLDQNDISCAIEKTYDDHSPLFVVIMRQNGTSSNRLLCHGFACATSEDAIVLAANLYKALEATMNRNNRFNSGDNGSIKKRKKVKCRNGLGTVCSVAGSSICGEGESDYLSPEKKEEDNVTKTDKNRLPKKPPPPRPQRKNKTADDVQIISISNQNRSKINLESDEIIAIDDYSPSQENERLSENKMEGKLGDIKDNRNEETCRYESQRINIRKNPSVCSWRSSNSEKVDSGDILTKLVIPRRGSFLNAPGPLNSRYGRFASDRGTGIISNNRKNSIHSPLGFIELFNELRIHEGLNNIDEILNTIIDVDGMSFNSLKPIYKEFIFKLAVTLTKDELYQRSKSIMQKQKRRKRQLTHNRRRRFVSGYRIKRAFHLSVSKLKSSPKCKIGLPFSSHIFPNAKKMHHNKPHYKTKMKLRRQNAASTFSITTKDCFESLLGFKGKEKRSPSDTCDGLTPDDIYKGEIVFHRKQLLTGTHVQNMTMTFRPVEFVKNSSHRDILNPAIEKNKREISHRRRNNHEDILGYVSCSECSYNSEICKYKSSRKCYCSMKNRHSKFNCGTVEGTDHTLERLKQSSVSSCSCDTDSCIDSEKCYCDPNKKPSIFEQLRRQGFAASESSLSRPSSPTTTPKSNENQADFEKNRKTCLQASKSLEFFHVQKNVSTFQLNSDDNGVDPIENRGNKYNDWESPSSHNPFPLKQSTPADKITMPMALPHKNCSALAEEGGSTSEYDVDQENNSNSNYHTPANLEDCLNYNYNRNDNDNYYGKGDAPESNDICLTSRHDDVREQNKILVVSARDQKGQVKNSVTPLFNKSKFSVSNFPLKFFKNETIEETDAISIKKTAEIAALFSDMKFQKKNHINLRCSKDIIYNSLDPGNGFLMRNRNSNRPMPIKNINLENSLGYFP